MILYNLGRHLKVLSIVGIVFSVLLACFGALFILGSVVNMTDPEQQHDMLAYILMLVFFGILPLACSGLLLFKIVKGHRLRKHEAIERRLLSLAKQHNGKLTVAKVAMVTQLNSQQAKQQLDWCHAHGLADLDISESGSVEYIFSGTL